MEEKVDQLDVSTSYYVDLEYLLSYLNKAKEKGATKILFDGSVNRYDEVDEVSITAYKE